MPLARIELRADIPGLQELRDRLNQEFKPEKRAKFMEDALEKAVQPLFRRLYETTPVGPTENLRRARAYKIVPYPLDGTAVAIVGYKRSARTRSDSALGGRVRSGPDRAFHQWWAEYGTQSRYVGTPANKSYTRKAHRRVMRSGKVVDVSEHIVARQGGYIASSFNQRGPFEFVRTPRMPRGQGGQRVQTQPSNAFFKKSSTPIAIPPMPRGGSSGRPPLETAFAQTQSQVAEILQRELRISIEAALSTLSTAATGFVDQ
jgi:hypothetical protein